MNGTRPRILIAGRHAAVRRALRMALERAGSTVVDECDDAATTAAAAGRERPDVCVLDADLPGGFGAALEAIRALSPRTRMVLLATELDQVTFLEAIRRGVTGFLANDADAARIATDVRAVADGLAALSPRFAAHLLETFRTRGPRAGLTPREAEVLDLLAEGMTTKEVALRLGVSATTVRRHVSSAAHRLGAAGREDAIARRPFRSDERG